MNTNYHYPMKLDLLNRSICLLSNMTTVWQPVMYTQYLIIFSYYYYLYILIFIFSYFIRLML